MKLRLIWQTIVDVIFDPFNIKRDVNHIAMLASKMQGDIHHTAMRAAELSKALSEYHEHVENYMFLEQVNKALDGSVPDMFWVKDINGRYIIANKAIREGLLFCDDPIGKTDVELANARKDVVGEENHTFGAICGNSDKEVLKIELPRKFNEDGLVSGQYLMLQVHKNVVRDTKGNVIAVVGVGRDITYQISTLQDIIHETVCDVAKSRIKELLDHYKFEDRQ